jgi:hypothetical protein
MNRRTGSLLVAILAIASVPSAAQWINYPTPGIPRTPDGKPDLSAPAPKTADGKPDLSGIWAITKGEGGLSQLKPSEIKPWALKLAKEREATLFKDGPVITCLPDAEPSLTKIVQTPGLIIMLRESLTYRQVFLDGRELPKDPNPDWMGYFVGRWEGDTLVVESTGYTDRKWLEAGYPHTENMRITERFHRGDFGHLTVDATFSDPETYEKPWTRKTEMRYLPDTDLLEYVCAENEKDRVHLVGANSDDTKNAVQLPPEVLSKYVGTYERQLSNGATQVIRIALEDGGLTWRGLGSRGPMTALSETAFTTPDGSNSEFLKNEKGDVTQLVRHVPEGDRHYERKP